MLNKESYINRLTSYAAIGLAFAALSGCGKKEANHQSQLRECYPEHIAAHNPLSKPNVSAAKLLRGIAILRGRLPRDNIISEQRIALTDYFYPIDAVYNKDNDNYYNLQSSKVNDPGEMFCFDSKTDQTYYSEAAYLAINSLKSAGIDINSVRVPEQ